MCICSNNNTALWAGVAGIMIATIVALHAGERAAVADATSHVTQARAAPVAHPGT
ncbi:hypothetical protein [Rhodoplanes roseus]|uniref:hypothetical protein n=1 Tax=Rhodoplanes roseus TaxID=29409 RepID=UPI00147602B0|nr:hypothetical protein [Rhodoplanes roseus]